MDDIDEDEFEPYIRPDTDGHPADVVARLMLEDEHRHLKDNDIDIEYLMVKVEKKTGGKFIIGAVHEPMVQGRLRDLFEQLLAAYFGRMPRFLMVLDFEWWAQADEEQREALVWHELCHIKQKTDAFGDLKFDMDGNPVYGLVEHDVTAFHSEVARYGAWSPDLQQFIAAARSADHI